MAPALPPAPPLQVRPPRVQESAVHLECLLRHTYEVKDPHSGQVTTTIVIGEVVLMHVHEGVAGEAGRQEGRAGPCQRSTGHAAR